MKKILIILLLLVLSVPVFAAEKIEETYIVQACDTLDSVANTFAQKANITNEKAIKVFREGIVENNYQILQNRQAHEIENGDTIKIIYWLNLN